VDLIDLTGNALEFCDDLASAVAWCTDPAAIDAIRSLVDHPEPAVRRSVAQALPRLARQPESVVDALVVLSRDPAADVRDSACHALAARLSDVDTPALRDALAARLRDPHRETGCEALLGLARRQDPRVRAELRTRLAGDDVWLAELMAAGALGDPTLHPLVRANLTGWPADLVPKVCATLRLTDPDGVGTDLLDGLARWYAGTDPDRYWWSVALHLLEQAPHRAVELADLVAARLDDAGYDRLLGSALAREAAAYDLGQ